MLRRLAAILLAGFALAGSCADDEAAMVKERRPHSTDLRLPRDPDIAVQEELDAARRAGTLAAYDLFLARHGDHRFAAAARRERARLAESPR